MKQDEYLQSLIDKMDLTDYIDIPDTVTTADQFWDWLQTVNSNQEENTMQLNGICLAYQRAYGFEVPTNVEPIFKVDITNLQLNFAQLYTMVGGFMRGLPFTDGELHIEVPYTDTVLMPSYRTQGGDRNLEFYSIGDCVAYTQTQIETGSKFMFATTRDIYNRAVSCANNYEALAPFTLELEYLVWMGQATIPFRLWLESKGLVKKVETPITFFHDPMTLELE